VEHTAKEGAVSATFFQYISTTGPFKDFNNKQAVFQASMVCFCQVSTSFFISILKIILLAGKQSNLNLGGVHINCSNKRTFFVCYPPVQDSHESSWV